MTEEEAKTKWCAFARVDSTGANRPNPGPNCDTAAGWPPCIGSACMAWRGGLWERVDRPAAMGVPDGPGWIKDGQESGIGGAVTNRQQWKREQFFCGLAGKP